MTTVNMKDYVNGNVNENKAVQEVIGKISKAETKVSANVINTVVPILGNKERTLEQRAEDIGELKGILASSIASGLSKVILKIPVRLLAMDTAYQIPERTERSLGKLLKEWDYDSCDPLLGVPHFEDGYIAVVDGTGRVRASNVIDSDKYEKLDVTVLLKAPSDPKERQKFEAKKYEYQNSGTEPLKDYQKHGARLIREDRPTMLLEELKHQYDFDWVLKKGQREGGILGSYPYTRELCEKYGRSCMEYILDICKKSGFNRLSNGYSRCVFKALRDMWRYYAMKKKVYLDVDEVKEIEKNVSSGNTKRSRSYLSQWNERDEAIINLGFHKALRVSAIISINIDDINWEDKDDGRVNGIQTR